MTDRGYLDYWEGLYTGRKNPALLKPSEAPNVLFGDGSGKRCSSGPDISMVALNVLFGDGSVND